MNSNQSKTTLQQSGWKRFKTRRQMILMIQEIRFICLVMACPINYNRLFVIKKTGQAVNACPALGLMFSILLV